MRAKILPSSLALMGVLLGMLPGTQALPKWLKPNYVKDGSNFAPREYSVYQPSFVTYGGYQYGGYGPQPTVQYFSDPSFSLTSESSGDLTSILSIPTTTEASSSVFISSETSSIVLVTTGTGPSSLTSSGSVIIDSDTYIPLSISTGTYALDISTAGGVLTKTISLSSYKYGSTTTPAPTTTALPLNCNHNNCLRQFIRSSTIIAGFCATYTSTINAYTTGLPDYVSMCHGSPSAISSACSCIVTGSLPSTTASTASLSSSSLNSSGLSSSSLTSGPTPTTPSTSNFSGTVSSSALTEPSSTNFEILTSSTLSNSSPSTTQSDLATLTTPEFSLSTIVDVTTHITQTLTQQTIVILPSGLLGTGSAGVPYSTSPTFVPYPNSSTTTVTLSSNFGTATSIIRNPPYSSGHYFSQMPHRSFSHIKSGWHVSSLTVSGGFSSSSISQLPPFPTSKTSLIAETTGTGSLPSSTFFVGTVAPYSSGILTFQPYSITNPSTTSSPIRNESTTSPSFGETSTFSAPGTLTSSVVGSLNTGASIISGGNLSVQTPPAPYSISSTNSSSALTATYSVGPTGTGFYVSSAYSSVVINLTSSLLSSTSTNGEIFTTLPSLSITSSPTSFGSTFSTSYYDPGQSLTSTEPEAAATLIRPSSPYYIPPPPPPGYYPSD